MDKQLTKLRTALKKLKHWQKPASRRKARRAVLGALTSLRHQLDKQYPSASPVRRKLSKDPELRWRRLKRAGWVLFSGSTHQLASLASAGIHVKRDRHRYLCPNWALWALDHTRPESVEPVLIKLRRSPSARAALMVEHALKNDLDEKG